MDATPPTTVGLIAGQGRFPIEVATAARKEGARIVATGLRELTEPSVAAVVDRFEWVYLGEFARMREIFEEEGARDLVMAGKVPKTFLWERRDAVRPDAEALKLLASLGDRKDDSLLGAVSDAFEQFGFRMRGQAELAPSLFASVGPIAGGPLDAAQQRDVAFGWPIAQEIGRLDVGQSVVVQNAAILALEAVEGTNAAIARGASLADRGEAAATICVVKVAKPSQDMRFDVPTIGLGTIEAMAEAGAGVLAIEAGRTVVLEREALVSAAEAHGIRVVGIDPAGPEGGS